MAIFCQWKSRVIGALSREARAPHVFPILFPASSGGVVNKEINKEINMEISKEDFFS